MEKLFTERISAKDFFSKYVEVVTEDKYMKIYRSDKEFTKEVNGNLIPNEVIKSLCPSLKCSNEYYRIDVLGYETHYEDVQEEMHKSGLGAYCWKPVIAVEHENSKKDWSDEVNKLLFIDCPLRVVISYNYFDERNKDFEKLDEIAKIINLIMDNKEIAGEFLIILGNGCRHYKNNGGKETYNKFDYRGYLYNNKTKKFEQI